MRLHKFAGLTPLDTDIEQNFSVKPTIPHSAWGYCCLWSAAVNGPLPRCSCHRLLLIFALDICIAMQRCATQSAQKLTTKVGKRKILTFLRILKRTGTFSAVSALSLA
jgi:hypothetical protein